MNPDVMQLLNALDHGDPHAAAQLLPLVYDELRKLAAQRMAQEQPGWTLLATATDGYQSLSSQARLHDGGMPAGVHFLLVLGSADALECPQIFTPWIALSDPEARLPHK
jgi:hypothetical protein